MTFCTRLLGLLFVAHLSLAATNLSITPPNDSLMFSPGWETGFNGQFLLVDDLGAVLSASLPASASHLYYIGLKRSGGSAYGFCIDCNGQSNGSSIVIVDGNDPTLANETLAEPVVLFSSSLDPASQHELTMLNLPDSRFNGASEVTLVSLLVTVEGNDETSVTSALPTTTALSTVTTQPSSTSDTGVASSSSSSSTPSSSILTVITCSSLSLSSPVSTTVTSNPSGARTSGTGSSANDGTSVKGVSSSLIAVIVSLSAVGLISLLVGLFVFFRKRNRRIRKRISEPMSFKDRRWTDPFGPQSGPGGPSTGYMKETSIGPLAAAGRMPPPRRQYDSAEPSPIKRTDSPASRISQNLWLNRPISGNQV